MRVHLQQNIKMIKRTRRCGLWCAQLKINKILADTIICTLPDIWYIMIRYWHTPASFKPRSQLLLIRLYFTSSVIQPELKEKNNRFHSAWLLNFADLNKTANSWLFRLLKTKHMHILRSYWVSYILFIFCYPHDIICHSDAGWIIRGNKPKVLKKTIRQACIRNCDGCLVKKTIGIELLCPECCATASSLSQMPHEAELHQLRPETQTQFSLSLRVCSRCMISHMDTSSY